MLLDGNEGAADYVEKALNYMHSEYVNGITIQQIANRLSINRSYLSEII